MAVAKYGAFITDLKGKIGGTVFKGSYGGSGVVQNRTGKLTKADAGRNVPSTGKLTKADAGRMMSITATMAGLWRTLTNSQREAWRAAAVNFPFKNKYGETYTGSGYQVFMRINNELSNIGESFIDVPPSNDAPPALPECEVTWTGNSILDLDLNTAVTSGYYMKISATSALSAGRGFEPGRLKQLGYIKNSDGTTINLIPWYTGIYGLLPALGLMYVQVQMINIGTGVTGVPQVITVFEG